MEPCFITTPTTFRGTLLTLSSRSRLRHHHRDTPPPTLRHARRTRHLTPPCMLAKFQQKQTNSQQDDDRPIDGILPPPILPTLSTLTGDTTTPEVAEQPVGTPDSSSSDSSPDSAKATDGDEENLDPQAILEMGAGIPQGSFSPVRYLSDLREELRLIEWPSPARVIRLTIIVIVTIIFATAFVYVVDGFFFRVSKVLFEESV